MERAYILDLSLFCLPCFCKEYNPFRIIHHDNILHGIFSVQGTDLAVSKLKQWADMEGVLGYTGMDFILFCFLNSGQIRR